MEDSKYVKYEDVKELLGLYDARDKYNDWSSFYEKYDREIKEATKALEGSVVIIDTQENNSMSEVKCDHCGIEVKKEDAVPCTWRGINLTWYHCKRCNKGVFGGRDGGEEI